MVLADHNGNVVTHSYIRHQTKVKECLEGFLSTLQERLGDTEIAVNVTGSVGMGVAEKCGLPFVQEVVAATRYVQQFHPETRTMIDIGGEDAKVVFFDNGKATDLRMNGNCSGGTGAFIDQMASLLHISASDLDALAAKSTQIYPIASRCGVFCKTDIQNLIARNVPTSDIAASIFHAVSVQTIVTLAHGHKMDTPILLCGGPLTFLPSLRKAFADNLETEEFIIPDNPNLIPAYGTAISENGKIFKISELARLIREGLDKRQSDRSSGLQPIFESEKEYADWRKEKSSASTHRTELPAGDTDAFLGIDSGSTTTKIVLLDSKGQLLFSHYQDNEGNPLGAVRHGLELLGAQCGKNGTALHIQGSCSTGYGEDLIKAAFGLDNGIVETMAHYMAARNIDPDVSFVLDIGGQDMKAMFVENGAISRIEVNEACSSGCGSFISTFASSLDCGIEEFTRLACLAPSPCDLGTRCTVFMNSKVKQVLRDGASISDIAAGLSYSVVKNCLYKVLRIKDNSELGQHIVVQGGTMRNDSVVRALEKLLGTKVFRSDTPELMGAMGCALYARSLESRRSMTLQEMLGKASYSSKLLHCQGCENRCTITRYDFGNNNRYFSGNRCEKIFSNMGGSTAPGINAYEKKRELLFGRKTDVSAPLMTIGIPQCLNMFEEYPFWLTLFTESGIQVRLSDVSTYPHYEKCADRVMSDNICFPAKLVHSHIENLAAHGADRIFMPFTLYERPDRQMQNSFNCPIVSGYSQVVNSVHDVTVDCPTISFKDDKVLYRQCIEYLQGIGVPKGLVKPAFRKALQEQERYEKEITAYNNEIFAEARRNGQTIVMLAGRPYHADSLIQHKVSEMIASQGVCVLTDDFTRDKMTDTRNVNYLSQWSYPNRIMKAAQWAANEGNDVQFMQLTSFGCGPDAFLIDEIKSLLARSGKNLTLLKIDDVNNIGSLKLRVRSLLESLKIKGSEKAPQTDEAHLPGYTKEQRRKKIIIPFFTPFISPLLPSILQLAGYDVDNLPPSDGASADWGLKYSNNEICYPATLIVGDIVKAFRSGAYDPDGTCVAITQTGGQCRASNYLSLIRKALIENGYTRTPVISVSFGSGIENYQPGFKVNWFKMLPVAVASILFSDSIAKFYYPAVVREKGKGMADALKEHYFELAKSHILKNDVKALYDDIASAAKDFNAICRDEHHPRVGIVGEIFLKFHPFAQKNTTSWLVDQGIEVVYPTLLDFFAQSFANIRANNRTHVSNIPDSLVNMLYSLVKKKMDKVNGFGKAFRYFIPFDDIFEKAEKASRAVTLSAQFGEGWLIPGEVAELYGRGVDHIISLQPFGCIANHIVEKGIENKLKRLYPGLNILSLDFDSSVSEVNVTNRLLLFIDNLSKTA